MLTLDARSFALAVLFCLLPLKVAAQLGEFLVRDLWVAAQHRAGPHDLVDRFAKPRARWRRQQPSDDRLCLLGYRASVIQLPDEGPGRHDCDQTDRHRVRIWAGAPRALKPPSILLSATSWTAAVTAMTIDVASAIPTAP